MEEGFEKKLKEYSADLLLLLAISAELRVIFKSEKLYLRHGVVLFAEKRGEYETMLDVLEELGASVCKDLRRKQWPILNNRIGIHARGLYDKAEDLAKFLEIKGFLPAVAVHGFIPESLQGEDLLVFENINKKDVFKELKQFVDEARNNPDDVKKSLERFKTSELYLNRAEKGSMRVTFEAAASLFCDFYRERNDERKTRERHEKLLDSISCVERISEKYIGTFDMAAYVRKSIEEYLDNCLEVLMCCVDEVEGEVIQAIEEGERFYLMRLGITFQNSFSAVRAKV